MSFESIFIRLSSNKFDLTHFQLYKWCSYENIKSVLLKK